MDRFVRSLWGVVAVLAAAGVAWFAADRWTGHEIAVARRALDARAAELAQRALAPGSPLGCLDAVANATVEAACERALFASPEMVAAAIAYVDAKLSLLADGSAHASRDPAYEAQIYRLRLGLEIDRFGVVAQALVSRGCIDNVCPVLKLFGDPRRIAINLKERTFDANVVLYASAWRPGSAAVAARSAAPANGVPVSGKYDFPTAASIPPVSIMNAEPPLSKTEETAIAPPAPEPAAKKQPPARRQQPAANPPLPPPAPIAPSAAPR